MSETCPVCTRSRAERPVASFSQTDVEECYHGFSVEQWREVVSDSVRRFELQAWAERDCMNHEPDFRDRCKRAEDACNFRITDLLQECRGTDADPVDILAARIRAILRGEA